jgi:hypothetical protein
VVWELGSDRCPHAAGTSSTPWTCTMTVPTTRSPRSTSSFSTTKLRQRWGPAPWLLLISLYWISFFFLFLWVLMELNFKKKIQGSLNSKMSLLVWSFLSASASLSTRRTVVRCAFSLNSKHFFHPHLRFLPLHWNWSCFISLGFFFFFL